MWTMIFLLWLIPIAIAVLVLVRTADGMPVLKENERELLFDETRDTEFGPWLALKFAALALVFSLLGLLQGIILPNLSSLWFVAGPLLTGTAAILVLIVWLRSAPAHRRRFQNRTSPISRLADMLFR